MDRAEDDKDLAGWGGISAEFLDKRRTFPQDAQTGRPLRPSFVKRILQDD
jgi:hypothetical protein